ncbi:4-hydroxy-tetrahydrodipicolinate synthase [Cellulosimicrobium aquatile]|uniref:4-hydroxy-tetrahydrodipicolinate synthase n=1 Tax=Cellulosimicrobium aquatile TaxID=1612203 RepID=A0A1N6Q4C0_9MICO|nr:dihydrodipicolinate synthase family protein [Cellulosimicrobium aquatile]SIQ11346.1 4-hydroxy-tetrahydrodipicolinate synthase [Cellulosimicrobium aquatile]
MTTAPEIITPPVTTYDASGALDLGALRVLLAHVEPEVDGVFAVGTTGEFPALDAAERAALVRTAADVFGPDRTIAHVGAASVHEALDHLRAAEDAGVRRFAAITPYYLTASDEGVVRYYASLRAATDGELYAYVFPDVACSDVSPELLAVLAELGLDGVKTSGSASARVDAYRSAVPRLALWSGNDADLPHVVAAGGRGTVSGVSGVAPRAFADLRAALAADDAAAVVRAQAVVQRLVAALGPSIARLKYGLDVQGLPGGTTRMPVDPPSDAVKAEIRAALAAAGHDLAAA